MKREMPKFNNPSNVTKLSLINQLNFSDSDAMRILNRINNDVDGENFEDIMDDIACIIYPHLKHTERKERFFREMLFKECQSVNAGITYENGDDIYALFIPRDADEPTIMYVWATNTYYIQYVSQFYTYNYQLSR